MKQFCARLICTTRRDDDQIVLELGLHKHTFNWNPDLNEDKNHAAAATAFLEGQNWKSKWAGGKLGDVYYWIDIVDHMKTFTNVIDKRSET